MPSSRAPGPEVRFYVPRDLHAKIVDRATRGERPVTREILRAIRAYLLDYDRLQDVLSAESHQNENGPA